ncbi:MAG: hypothetical protein D4S02_06025 [Rhodocyclaceae bacterium]|nr:MAG: hypothetical protein D4S02_06025 [Rhodocyclaceae bacterium]
MRRFRRPDGRFYEIAEPTHDLLGDRVISTYHGSIYSRRGGVHIYLADHVSVDDIALARIAHGYVEVGQERKGI